MIGARIVTVERYAAGDYDEATGIFVRGSTETLQVSMSLQPMGDRDLISVEEGNRTKEWVKAYTKTKLNTDLTGRSADRLIYNGIRYKVMSCQDQMLPGPSMGLRHYKVTAVREEDQET